MAGEKKKLEIQITLLDMIQGVDACYGEILRAMADDAVSLFSEDPGKQIQTILIDAANMIDTFDQHDADQPISLGGE